MQFHQRKELTDNIDRLAKYNSDNPNYISYPFTEIDMKKVTSDFELLRRYARAYDESHKSNSPSVGDCLLLPDQQVVYFCSINNDKIQTCEGGSFHLCSNGFISYSGELDSGICLSDMELTEERYVLPIWFSHRGILCGGCGIYASIGCRVWITKPNANLSGIPQVRRLRRQKLKEQSETIEKFDAMGNSYHEHLPEVIIKKENLPDGLIQSIMEITGLDFEDSYRYVPVYWCQPMQLRQLELLKSFLQFTISEERDFNTHDLVIILSIDK